MSVKLQERKKKYVKTTLKYRKMGSGFNDYDDNRIRKVAIEMVESNGKKPLGKIMIENGYSKAYAKNPQKLTRTKTWENIIKEILPYERLARKLADKLDAKIKLIKRNMDGIDEIVEIDNDSVQIKALELGMKARGLFNQKTDTANNGQIFSLTDLARKSIKLSNQIEKRAEQRKKYYDMHKESGVIDLSKV